MVNINSLERDGLRQAELCPRHTMKMKTKNNLKTTKAAILFCLLLIVLLLARFIVVSVMSICLVCNFSIVATCPSIQLPALLFVCVLFLLFVDVLFGEPRQN